MLFKQTNGLIDLLIYLFVRLDWLLRLGELCHSSEKRRTLLRLSAFTLKRLPDLSGIKVLGRVGGKAGYLAMS